MSDDATTTPAEPVEVPAEEPVVEAKPRKVKQQVLCACGCGESTGNAFRPGHDNRFYGQVVKGQRDPAELDKYPGLLRKWENRSKAAAVAAREAAIAAANTGGWTKVKIGRWQQDLKSVTETVEADGTTKFEVKWVERKTGNTRTSIVDREALS